MNSVKPIDFILFVHAFYVTACLTNNTVRACGGTDSVLLIDFDLVLARFVLSSCQTEVAGRQHTNRDLNCSAVDSIIVSKAC